MVVGHDHVVLCLYTGDQVHRKSMAGDWNTRNVLSVQQVPNSKNDMTVVDILFWCLQVIAQQKSQKQSCCEVQGPVVGPSDCSFRQSLLPQLIGPAVLVNCLLCFHYYGYSWNLSPLFASHCSSSALLLHIVLHSSSHVNCAEGASCLRVNG